MAGYAASFGGVGVGCTGFFLNSSTPLAFNSASRARMACQRFRSDSSVMVSDNRPFYPIAWDYGESDPAMMLWTAALKKWDMRLPADARVLELGCAETDFLERLQRFNPGYQLTGVDCYPQPRANVIAGDACDLRLFEHNTLDAVILLGSLEHFGLGFYGDPIYEDDTADPFGDRLAMQNVQRWLKPGGWCYFDVPCNPRGRIQANRHFRQYAPSEVAQRLIDPGGLVEAHRGYSWPEPNAGAWCAEPTEELVPYWFVAVVAEKP